MTASKLSLKRASKQQPKKVYQRVSNEQRQRLIELIQAREKSIADAAKIVGVGYECAKAINRTFRLEGRVEKIINYRRVPRNDLGSMPEATETMPHSQTDSLDQGPFRIEKEASMGTVKNDHKMIVSLVDISSS